MFGRRRIRETRTVEPWGAQQFLALFIGGLVLVLLLGVGLGVGVSKAFSGSSTHSAAAVVTKSVSVTTEAAQGQAHRDAIAAAPMTTEPEDAAYPSTPAVQQADNIDIPASTTTGIAGVATGFPQTPQGAVGQLGAILSATLEQMSIPAATQIYNAWALPGGVGANNWPEMQGVAQFLTAVNGTDVMPRGYSVSDVPAAAIVKGTDGSSWTLACVLTQFTATGEKTQSAGIAFCDRMQWTTDPGVPGVGGRWEIAPGSAPAAAPSTWPGSAAAVSAGWLTWAQPSQGGQ